MIDSPSDPPVSARTVHREQVWAALIHAVDVLLAEARDRVVAQAERESGSDYGDRLPALEARIRMLDELRREVTTPPPAS